MGQSKRIVQLILSQQNEPMTTRISRIIRDEVIVPPPKYSADPMGQSIRIVQLTLSRQNELLTTRISRIIQDKLIVPPPK